MGFGDFQLNNNGKKEQLRDIKQGVRKEQLDKKYHALFDAYDANNDGTLEAEELNGILKGLQSFAGADKVLDSNENIQAKSIFATRINIQNADFQGFVKSVSDASAEILSSSEKQTPDGGKEVTTTFKDGTVETILYYPDGEFKFKKTIKNSVNVLSESQNLAASQALGNTANVVASEKARAKIPNIENAIKELIEDGVAVADIARKYKIDKNKLSEYYNSLLAPVSEDELYIYGDVETFKKLREYVANNTKITVATLNNGNPEQQVTIVSYQTNNGNFYKAYDIYGEVITTEDLHFAFGITKVKATDDGAFRFETDSSKSVEVSQSATRRGNVVTYYTTLKDYLNDKSPKVSVAVSKNVKSGFSERAQDEIEIKQAILQHFVDSRQEVQEYLKSMGVLDNAGAWINANAGELWNTIKNNWKGTDEEYQNFYELLKKYQSTASQASKLDVAKTQMDTDKILYLNDFEGATGLKASVETCSKFYNTIIQYQNATILKDRIEILDKAMLEINAYQDDINSQKQVGRRAQGLTTENHIDNAKALLLQYCGGDKEAVNALVDSNKPEAVIETIKGIKAETDKQYQSVLGGKKYDDVKADYQKQYKVIYGTDFVPDELTEKIMDAKATGSMVKLAAITIISILVTRSPMMAEINGAIAGSAEATGAAANLMRTLVNKYGQTAVREGVKFAMTSGTLATDVGLTLLNQVTSKRGIDGQELLQSAKGSAKYIYFGAYIGSPIAEAVGNAVGKIGLAKGLMNGGASRTQGAIKTTTLTGDKVFENILNTGKGIGQKLTVNGAKFGTDVAMFSALGIITDGQEVGEAFEEQATFLPKLKIMNHVLEYVMGRALGGKVGSQTSLTSRPQDARMETAIEKSGIKNWTIKEMKSPSGTRYTVVDDKGIPQTFNDVNKLVTAMMERVAKTYETVAPKVQETVGNKGEVKLNTDTSEATTTPRTNTETENETVKQLSQEEINNLKSSDPSIRQMPDGTVIKTDKQGFTTVIGKLYDKAVGKVRSIVASLSSAKLLNSSNRESHIQLLTNLKDENGIVRYTRTEIEEVLNNLPSGIEVKGKDLYALMTLPEISVENAIGILSKVDSPEKLKVLSELTNTNDRVHAFQHNFRNIPDNELNAYEIENIMYNISDSKVTDISKMFGDAISERYNNMLKGDIKLAPFLLSMSFHIKTDLEKEAFYNVLSNTKSYDDDLKINHDILFNHIINNVSSDNDLKILQNILKNVDNVDSSGYAFSVIASEEPQKQRFLQYALAAAVNDKNVKYSSIDIHRLMCVLANNRDNPYLSSAKILDMLKNGTSIDDVLILIQKTDFNPNSSVASQRIFNRKYGYDIGTMTDIKCENDFQQRALNMLLDANGTQRFEALGVKDIIANVKDENSLTSLKRMLEDPNIDTHTIIKSLKTGKYVETTIYTGAASKSTIKKLIGFGGMPSSIKKRLDGYLDNLVKLNNSSPKRFKKMLDSGLFGLIKEGKIELSILKNINETTFLSNRTLSDIKKIRNGEPLIKTLSSTENLSNISRFVQNGDVCEVNGKLYVNENGVATEIKLSKEKFEELFPPLTSVSFEQYGLGDCWLVTTLDNFMDLPLGRASIYKLFEQQGNDVLIKFPNGTNPIRFENGEVLDADSKQIVSASYKTGNSSSQAPIGIQMVEQAYAVHRNNKYDTGALTTEILAHSTNVEALMQELKGGWTGDATNEILGTDTTVDSYGINLQNREQMKEYIKQFANDENVLTFFSTRDIKGGHDTALMEKYDLYGNHAYSVKGYDETTGMVYITNPWHTSVVTEVPLYELMKYIIGVNFAHFKK